MARYILCGFELPRYGNRIGIGVAARGGKSITTSGKGRELRLVRLIDSSFRRIERHNAWPSYDRKKRLRLCLLLTAETGFLVAFIWLLSEVSGDRGLRMVAVVFGVTFSLLVAQLQIKPSGAIYRSLWIFSFSCLVLIIVGFPGA